ncbi:MAG: hypothetical protein IJ837_01015 [Clostridia bacterium]|nr:hypothetical protein [Clostridia bacterium]
MNYTNLINKKVVSVYEGKVEGIVFEILFNKNFKLTKLIIKTSDEQFKTLNTKDVFCFDECIVIKNNSKLIVSENENKESYLNKEVITLDGKILGTVVDLNIENLKIKEILTLKTAINPEKIVSNNNIIIVNNSEKTYKKHQFKPKNKIIIKQSNNQKVVITSKIPIKVVPNNSLIGKRLFRDLINNKNIILARKNAIITPKLLNLAKEQNCLNSLINSII